MMKTVSFREIARIGAGQSAPQERTAFEGVGKPFIRAGSLDSLVNGGSLTNLEHINNNSAKIQKMRLYPKDTVVFAKSGISATKDRVFVLPSSAYVVSHLATIELDTNIVDPFFIKYFWMRFKPSTLIKDEAYPSISAEEISNVRIQLPSLPEQKRIAATLQKADRIRRLRRYARQLSDGYLQSVFLEMFGRNSTNLYLKFADVLLEEPKNGLYLPSEKYGSGTPIIRIDAFYDGVLGDPKKLKRVQAMPQEIDDFSVKNEDILINRVNSIEFLGKCALVQGLNEPTLFESNMMRIRVNRKIALPTYVAKYLTTQYAYSQILQRARKAVNQASINQEDVKSIIIPVPPLHDQALFSEFVRQFEKVLEKIVESERQAEQLFQSLLHQAFEEN